MLVFFFFVLCGPTHLRFLCPPVVFVVRLAPLLPLLPVVPPPHVLPFLIQEEIVTRTFGKALSKKRTAELS